MISTILNELSVQIVSDPFPKPKQFSNLIRCHQCQSPCTNQFQAFRSFLFSDFNHRAQNTNTNLTGICSFLFIQAYLQANTNTNLTGICSFLFIQACLQANTNTNLTGILFLPFHPKPVLKQITITANTNADTKQIKQLQKQQIAS